MHIGFESLLPHGSLQRFMYLGISSQFFIPYCLSPQQQHVSWNQQEAITDSKYLHIFGMVWYGMVWYGMVYGIT